MADDKDVPPEVVKCEWPQCRLCGKCRHPELCGTPYDPEEG